MRNKPIIIVQGGLYGSEAKGAIAAYLCETRGVHYAVRTGATNAGHTVYTRGGKVFKAQQLPVGFENLNTVLVIGAGALIDPEILDREVKEISDITGQDIRQRLKIDRRAGLHLPSHAVRSKTSGRHHAIGATGKGCSEALIDRIKVRGTDSATTFGESPYSKGYDVCDTEALLNYAWNEGAQILLEGTQGQLLDLYLGPYPYTTHKQTGPAQWMLECGLSPALPVEICMVVRTFPIRVAGNSGPMESEISWPILAREINAVRKAGGMVPLVGEDSIQAFESAVRGAATSFRLPSGRTGLDQHEWSWWERSECREALSELNRAAWEMLPEPVRQDLSHLFEMTTVTKKLRRISRLDRQTLETASRQVRPAWVALTFMNYLFPQCWYQVPDVLPPDGGEFTKWVEEACGAPVRLWTWGPRSHHIAGSGR